MNSVKLLSRLATTTFIVVLASIAYIAFLLFYPVKITTPRIQPYHIVTPIVQHGESVIYTVDACKFKDYPGIITRFFKSGETLVGIESSPGFAPVGCHKTDVPVKTPPTMNPGMYSLVLNVAYKINPLRTITYTFTTETFEVTK